MKQDERKKVKRITFIVSSKVHQDFLKIVEREDRTQVRVFEKFIESKLRDLDLEDKLNDLENDLDFEKKL